MKNTVQNVSSLQCKMLEFPVHPFEIKWHTLTVMMVSGLQKLMIEKCSFGLIHFFHPASSSLLQKVMSYMILTH